MGSICCKNVCIMILMAFFGFSYYTFRNAHRKLQIGTRLFKLCISMKYFFYVVFFQWVKMAENAFSFFFGTFSFSGNIPSICRLGKNVWNNVQTFWKYCWLRTTRLRIFYRIRILKYKPGGYKNWRNACEISVLWDMGEMFRWRISKSYTLLKYFFHKMQNLE